MTSNCIGDVTHGDYKPHVEDYCSLILVIYITDHFIILLRVPNESQSLMVECYTESGNVSGKKKVIETILWILIVLIISIWL